MKKFLSVLISLALAASLAACGAAQSSKEAEGSTASAAPSAPTASVAALSGKVSTNGSTSMEKVIGALSEAFMQQNSGVDVTYDPTGSGAGITAATDGTTDIGLSSRALKAEETGLTQTVVALDGIAIIVNTKNTVKDLTIEQIAGLATGKITNWKDVGGTDAPVVLVGREAGSGTRDGFETITGTKEKCKYAQELTATGAVITAVQSNENAFGYASLSAIKDTVKAVTVGGVAPSEQAVLDGSYKIQRPFVLITKDGAALSEQAKAFISFATSPASADIIKTAGAIPPAK